MPAFSARDRKSIDQAESDVQSRLVGQDIDFESLGVMSNLFRVSNRARYHMERSVLSDHEMSFTAFTALWVLWIWGPHEARHLAIETGITKGTLTGVVNTLMGHGLVEREPHPTDGRLVLIDTTEKGKDLMVELFPLINKAETFITSSLDAKSKRRLADDLRSILRTLEDAQ